MNNASGTMPTETLSGGSFFQRADCWGFATAAVVVFVVYLLTLAPDVSLGFAGIFSTGAMYAGVPHPPGYPLWTLYAWVFTEILPFSNIAWRAGVASAFAGALACGVVALLVSRCAARLANGLAGWHPVPAKDERIIRIVCGAAAGMGFGLDGEVWRKALIADPLPLSLLMFSLVICLLTRWQHDATRTRWLVLAVFCYGLTLTNSQALIPAALGLPIFALGHRPPGFKATVKLAAGCGAMFLAGLSLYLYVPIASMTNPPINWGYARTLEGFFHTLTRGQYERMSPTTELGAYLAQLGDFVRLAAHDLGWHYLLAAMVPFFFWHRMQICDRRWMIAMLAVFLSLSAVMVFLLNPAGDRQSFAFVSGFYTASHLVLAIWSGCGLLLLVRSLLAFYERNKARFHPHSQPTTQS